MEILTTALSSIPTITTTDSLSLSLSLSLSHLSNCTLARQWYLSVAKWLTFQEDELLYLSTGESSNQQSHWFTELIRLSPLELNLTTKSCGQYSLHRERAKHPVE